jgi:hypothetical protein
MERVYVERKVKSSPGSREASLAPGAISLSKACETEPPFAIVTPTSSSIGTTPQRTPHGSFDRKDYETNQQVHGYLSEQLARFVHTIPEPVHEVAEDSRRSNSKSQSSSSGDPYLSGLQTASEKLADVRNQVAEGFPNRGSALHDWGACKPCAFFLKDGCLTDDCQFCHLCEPGEKKRRKKERLSIRRDMREKQRFVRPAGPWRQ